ncbi:hypothetical protein Pnap_4646 (plasmid) [Polaromonas naphthalenivorans CJ2]|uniref:Uncharacterized protein n=1 Tax=Polaromonas naphthalenivorans (strain CJ2) TaxID=365044 RepID=A1VWN5_POLNA|nr:hypothetical protein Pnap_4646 [Polaromonas naphthalenivorans CJ2]
MAFIFLQIQTSPIRKFPRQIKSLRVFQVDYKGLKKNTLQLKTLFALSNLWMSRNRLMQAQA